MHRYNHTGALTVSLLSLLLAKDCGELVTPTNGSSFGNLTTYPHEKIFSCDEGFILRGSRTRQCLPSGNWSGNTTICVGTYI